ncbi:MAG TPA: EAL domain-containing protein [Thermoleophilaceae bacterium]|nr:EAL domain-containing protein [Thermoleophilaceae bacterium]
MSPHATAVLRLRARLGAEAPIWLLGAGIAVAAAALYAGVVANLPHEQSPRDLPWWVLAGAFALAEAWVVHFHFRRSSHSFSLGELPLVFGLLFLSPHELLLASVVGSTIPLALDREIPPVKVAFNVAQFTLGTCVALAAFEVLAPSRDALEPAVWSAALVAVFATALVADITVGAAIGLTEGGLGFRTRLEMLTINWGVATVNGCLALAAATVYAVSPAASLFLVIPAAMLIFAYRAYMSERRRHTELEFLHEATGALSRSPEIVPELEVLLERTRAAFRVESAELVLFSAEFGPSLRSTLGPGDRKQMLETLDAPVVERLRAFAERCSGVTSLEEIRDGDLRSWWFDRGLREGVVVALRGERVVGLLVLAGRVGVQRSFSRDELRLVETLAGNVTVALQYDHLEHAVRELTTLRAELEREAFYDSLTGLANRSLFINRVDKALRTRHEAIYVLFIDIDDFKTINDTLGHQAGDEVLHEVAKRLLRCLRDGDTAARLGGDEFAVLLEGGPTEEDAVAVAERTLAEFRNPVHVGDEGVSIQLSIGVAKGVRGKNSADDLLRNADVAMYGAKGRGKNQLRMFEPGMQRAIEQRHRLKRELERAIARREFSVHYQPIIDLQSGDPVAVEALVRWDHQERGSIPPGDFIPFAEETGLIVPIGEIVLEDACRQAALLGHGDGPDGALGMHVNVSTIELLDPDFLVRLDTLVLGNGLSPWQITIEITEHVLMFDEHQALATLEDARARGYKVAIDDFGTGYSSLAYLRSLPIDTIKIPKAFTDGVGGSTKDDMFARAVIDFGSKLDVTVVAEGVERAEQAAILRSLGCELAQGFFFARPVEAKDARHSLELVAA